MKAPQIVVSDEMQAATDVLVRALLDARPIARYLQAEAAMATDANADALVRELAKVQSELRRRQGDNIADADIDRLRRLRRAVESNLVISEAVESRDEAMTWLREVTQEISKELGLDFAGFARRGGC